MKLSEIIKPYSPRQLEARKYIGKGRNPIIFYGGSRGGGKSHLVLYATLENALRHKHFTAAIIRKSSPELYKWFIPEMMEQVPQKLFKWNEKRQSAYFYNTGARVDFLGLESDSDMIKIKGIPYSMISIDEANAYDVRSIEMTRGSLRNLKTPQFVPTLLMTGNPGEKSDLWFKRHFVHPQYEYWTEKDRLKNKDSFIFVPARVDDNPDPAFVETLKSTLEALNDTLKRQWLDGDWTTFAGQFFAEWDESVHVVEPFRIPRLWDRVVGIDEGRGARPSVVLWAAQNPQDKTVYIYRELSSFLKPAALVEEIRSMMEGQAEEEVVSKWIADTSMFVSETASEEWKAESPAMIFQRNGIYLTKANKDRVNGWRVLKQWLDWRPGSGGGIERQPKLKVFSTCRSLIETLPILKYKAGATKDDLDTDMQDDAADALRYLMVGGYSYPDGYNRDIWSEIDAEPMVYDSNKRYERFEPMRRDLVSEF